MRRAIVLSAAAGLLLTGCGIDARTLPLPGTRAGDDTTTIEAAFDDALNLSVGSKVSVNGVDAGRVTALSTDGFSALAEMSVDEGVRVTDLSSARLRYDTPLGEVYVDVTTPEGGRAIKDGGRLDPARSTTAPTVEDALASASLLINGGGIGDLGRIVDELNGAVGDGTDLTEVLDRSATFLTQANRTTAEIDRALTSLDAVSATLSQEQDTITDALAAIGPAARTVRQQTKQIIALLNRLVKLSRDANNVLDRMDDATVAVVRDAGAILAQVRRISGELGPGLDTFSAAINELLEVIPADHLPIQLRVDIGESVEQDPLNPLPPLLGTPGTSQPQTPWDLDDLLGAPGEQLPGLGGEG
ncbi:MCE family protein [Nocardioides sp. KC13]|uniref:MCE family protein n=1 Tax=Nocardioides turkmenicus TaxID=2711220 RepID=A0A6M1R6C2_9ACTN|nr:MCE family protein [Nocardioides sp. KC13]NGN94231.1 MCE family protein [Nocardioides sp. KC13]